MNFAADDILCDKRDESAIYRIVRIQNSVGFKTSAMYVLARIDRNMLLPTFVVSDRQLRRHYRKLSGPIATWYSL